MQIIADNVHKNVANFACAKIINILCVSRFVFDFRCFEIQYYICIFTMDSKYSLMI